MEHTVIGLVITAIKSLSHILVAVVAAAVIQILMPQAREIRVYIATTIGSILVGFLASLTSQDAGLSVFISHTMAAVGGALIYGVANQAVLINNRLAKSDSIADAVIDVIEDKIKRN